MAAAASHGRGAKAARRPAAARALADAGAPSCASICGHRSRRGLDRLRQIAQRAHRMRWFTGESVMSVNLHAESFAQQPARTVQLRLAGALGDAEHLRRLDVRIAVQRVQHQRIARPVGQPTEADSISCTSTGVSRVHRRHSASSSSLASSTAPALRRLPRRRSPQCGAARCQRAARLECASARQALIKVSCVQSSANWAPGSCAGTARTPARNAPGRAARRRGCRRCWRAAPALPPSRPGCPRPVRVSSVP